VNITFDALKCNALAILICCTCCTGKKC